MSGYYSSFLPSSPAEQAFLEAMIPKPMGTMGEADIRRIVREEIEARFPPPSVLDVTPEEVRHWMGVRR